ncbi:hypothetical protein BD289DRAFT_422646 [Coniella lustricola]|uniref:Uncharacterized protein n=1 Tax=Coniella lustricola TaxID=2025994 RepID=A0A2T3AKD2_9PEZI|nr:hypothetical protein BD289DRAFT_422646 [Coniella lustricola]
MSLIKAYQGLSSKARLGLGVGLVAWGVVGLYMSDRAEEKFGFTPSEKEKAEIERLKPKLHIIDNKEERP